MYPALLAMGQHLREAVLAESVEKSFLSDIWIKVDSVTGIRDPYL